MDILDLLRMAIERRIFPQQGLPTQEQQHYDQPSQPFGNQVGYETSTPIASGPKHAAAIVSKTVKSGKSKSKDGNGLKTKTVTTKQAPVTGNTADENILPNIVHILANSQTDLMHH